jgi:phosphate uptake regulator
MGLGVVEQADTHATLRCSVAPSDFDLPTLLGRIGRTEATMRTDAVRAVVEADADRARAVASRYEQVEKLFYLFLRLVFATYRNPRLNQAVGLETGFPLIGFRSVAQDLVLMADVACEIAGLVTDGEPVRPDEPTGERLTTLEATLDDGIDTTIAAVATPTHEATTSARDHLDRVAELAAELNDHLAAERPEPLLVCQRTVTLLERSARHARDSLSVATHLAFRADTELVDR